MVPSTQKINFYRGDSFLMELTVRDSDNSLEDLTGVSIRGQIRDESDVLVGNFSFDLSNAADGLILVQLSAASSESWVDDTVLYSDIEVTYPDTTRRTVLILNLIVIGDVSHD